MLELLDLTQTLQKSEYATVMPALRAELRDLQQAILAAGIPVVVLLEGWDAAGKGDAIGTLVYPLDPRGFKVCTTHAPTEDDRFRPYLYRFWTRMPARGNFTFFDRGWHRRLLESRIDGELDKQGLKADAGEIREFERQLTDDGTVLMKFWLQTSKKEQKRRLEDIANDRYERWRLQQPGRRKQLSYRRSVEVAEEMLALTSTANAPWTLIAAESRYFRRVDILHKVVAALRHALVARNLPLPVPPDDEATVAEPVRLPDTARVQIPPPIRPTLLDRVDLTRRLDRTEYEKQLDPLQRRLQELELECYHQRLPVVVVYEGWDAAGKGGNIKRLTQELDPRGYEVTPIAAPDATEKARHYLWRFWRQLPKAGHIAIFDRSWYGRVLVERVESFAAEPEWRRAYQEINEFERHQTEAGAVLVKFWMHISPEEQLRRFEERERVPHKRHKITADDWRNRARWEAYREAVVEMIERTSTSYSPWTIVEAEDKYWGRIKTLQTLVSALEEKLGKGKK
jgi:polyphosphate:AMP phosphotransferase